DMTTLDEQVTTLMHGAEFGDAQLADFMRQELRQRLAETQEAGRPLRVYCGYDATGPHLHLGHTVTMRKLRQFQDFGHAVTVLIGTFTAAIGDASDRDSARTPPSAETIRAHASAFLEQVFRVLDRDRTAIRFNNDWLDGVTFRDLIEISGQFTVQQMTSRDNFSRRIEAGEPLWLRELLYPLAQGYDAVALQADVQLGGTEQLFNLMTGRKLQTYFGQPPQICITYPILPGTDGVQRMSKSMGNFIGITEPPEDQYGKVMSLPDTAMPIFFDLVTRWPPAQIEALKADLEAGRVHPMQAKQRLAWEVVASFYGDETADAAAAHFTRVHRQGDLPDAMPEFPLAAPAGIIDVLVESGLVASRGEAKRLVRGAGVRLDGEPITDVQHVLLPGEAVLQVGRRHFLRLVAAVEPAFAPGDPEA
ncbi:MAG: tyrosine--tRNA ligase, partial [Anaerolineae bacterium]|nr:tyrosine--tRNA ligase [Anaerolineae bacterium]